jgi:hypothetical protein
MQAITLYRRSSGGSCIGQRGAICGKCSHLLFICMPLSHVFSVVLQQQPITIQPRLYYAHNRGFQASTLRRRALLCRYLIPLVKMLRHGDDDNVGIASAFEGTSHALLEEEEQATRKFIWCWEEDGGTVGTRCPMVFFCTSEAHEVSK